MYFGWCPRSYALEVHLNCHPSQTSILNPQFSILIVPQSVVHLCLYHMYHKCGTSVVHKRGLTRFLDILSIMHLMYVNIFYCSINVLITNIVLDSLCFISLDYNIHTFIDLFYSTFIQRLNTPPASTPVQGPPIY